MWYFLSSWLRSKLVSFPELSLPLFLLICPLLLLWVMSLSSFSTDGYYYMNFEGREQPTKGIYEDD